ncbi:hypothetical protein C2I36_16305, partial [Rhodobacteraceae bacterium WD3A24]
MYKLQSMLAPPAGRPAALYLRGGGGHGARAGEPVALGAGETLSLDTFFGAFYRAYWRRHTAVESLAVSAEIAGPARLRIIEAAGGVRRCLVEHEFAAGAARRCLRLPDEGRAPARGSRLYAEIEALGPCEIRAVDFVTDTPPARRATLSIGICTFNQEERLARTLTRLAGIAREEDAIRAVYVVNQGAPFARAETHALLRAPGITSLAQRNLGGCGGFTRTLMEALESDAPATHHLMMDDDIELDARLISRALRFLDYAHADIALGAGMLDSQRPSVMHEAGAFLTPDNRIEAYCHDVDLADPGEQGHFDTPVATDFNAWWFCILPLARCREVGLPPPLFIRGDDFEYGQRLAEAGVATVTLPGIAVWHEPFHARLGGWQSYYDLRNRLIFAALHGGKVRQLSLARVVGMITTAVLTHDYRTARLRLRAVEDFLAGPDRLLARDPEDIHADILALARRGAPEALADPALKARPAARGRAPGERMGALIRQHFAAMLRTGLGPLDRAAPPILEEADAHPANTAGRAYILTNTARDFHLRLAPRRGTMWALLGRAALAGWRFRR